MRVASRYPAFCLLLNALSIAAMIVFAAACVDSAGENPPMEGFDMEGSDPRAVAIADSVMAAMGGRAAWDATRYLSWSFGADDHVWDKHTGAIRYQRDSIVVVMDVDDRSGRAWIDGQEVSADSTHEDLLARAYRAWINSGYWFLLPYKLKDSGVTLTYLREDTTADGRDAHVLHLEFDNVGLTPNNMYDVFVDKETKLVTQWSHYRERSDEEPRFTRPMANWQRYGRIMLSDHRGEGGGGQPFILPNVGAYDDVPPIVFSSPEPIDMAILGA